MITIYKTRFSMFFGMLVIMSLAVSCKKNNVAPATINNFATIGLYEYEVPNSTKRRVFITISKVGDLDFSTPYPSVFDTGSSGMTIDASGILPASMITSTGIVVPGDSVVVNGITVTSQASYMSYGDNTGTIREYGNLAYAPIKIGDANGNITTRRIPIFMYYKVVNLTTGEQYAAHSNDVFGVGPGTNSVGSKIMSPLSYFTSSDITTGFKLATLNSSYFSTTGATYVAGLLSIGLTNNDLTSSGFIMHPLTNTSAGYSSNIPATISYNGQSIPATVLFDTGTPSQTIIEDRAAQSTIGALPVNTVVTVTTNRGFVYTYTTNNTTNLTAVENPNITGDSRTIFSIDFFVNNEYLVDYQNHQIGLKNN